MVRILAGIAVAVPATGLLTAAGPAMADDTRITLELPQRTFVSYVEDVKPDAGLTWYATGSAVHRVVFTLTDARGIVIDRTTAPPDKGHTIWIGMVGDNQFGKWTAKVVAYARNGGVLGSRSLSYFHKGNTQIKDFNAAPEPVRKGQALTVKGRLLHVKFHQAPWYIAYAGKPIRIYFRVAGSNTWKYTATATTGRDGRFKKSFTAKQDGTWRAYFPGTSRFHHETTAGDYVDVR